MSDISPGRLDPDERAAKLAALGDPLVARTAEIDFGVFPPSLQRVREQARKNYVGAKPSAGVLFQTPISRRRYHRSGESSEYRSVGRR